MNHLFVALFQEIGRNKSFIIKKALSTKLPNEA